MSSDNRTSEWSGFQLGVELTPDAPVPELVELATAAEAAGIDAVFVSNHYNNRDPLVTLSPMAVATEEVQLGPGVVNPYEAHPVRMASQMATLDELSGGRAICGIGAGDRSTLGALGIERSDPVETVAETVDVARRLWNGEVVDHDGTFGANAASLSAAPRSIPIFVGAQGPVMLRMSAATADGILVNASHPADYRWARQQIDDGLARRDEQLGEPVVAGFVSVSIDEDPDRARQAARPPVAFITAGSPEQAIDRHDIDPPRVREIQDALSAGDRTRAYELVTPAMLEAFCVAGTPEAVGDRLLAVLDYVDTIVAASPLGPERSRAIDLIGDVGDRLLREREVEQ